MSGSVLDVTSDKIAADINEYLVYSGFVWPATEDDELIAELRNIVYKNLEGFGLEVKYGNEIEE